MGTEAPTGELSLGQLQRALPVLVSKLIVEAYRLGFELSFGETWRSTATARANAEAGKGIANSLHCDRLAIDLNVFKDGEYQKDIDAYRKLGAYWKSLHPQARWGGDFKGKCAGDADHFSLTFGGRA